MQRNLPVYSLSHFRKAVDKSEFYCNTLSLHVKEHAFTHLPHKHDFYLVVMVTKGSGWHEVDFERYPVGAGSVFMMRPGQMHYWKLSDKIQGYVFFHTKDFYDKGFNGTGIDEYAFFKSFQSQPFLKVSHQKLKKLSQLMSEVLPEYKNPGKHAHEKIHALVSLIYIELSRNYTYTEHNHAYAYYSRLSEFEKLIEKNYREAKSVRDYANKLNISEKHLNRIVRTCLNKTATQLITDRVILEAKRLLIQTKMNVSKAGYELGFTDISYFTRLFKKHTGETPMTFLKKQLQNT